ncbi:MAG: ferritin [Desulfobulbus propionicus]|nr:MAG: ferritin [Desulfobulbus propionicus]
MLNDKVLKALNDQINAELFSSYFYLAMEAYLHDRQLTGCATWMRAQAAEELTHAMKIYDYVVKSGGRIILEKIDRPEHTWESPLHCFEATLEHEQYVTSLISALVEVAIKEGDDATKNMLDWFVSEQEEEEESVGEVLEKFKHAGNDTAALAALDAELGKRSVEVG